MARRYNFSLRRRTMTFSNLDINTTDFEDGLNGQDVGTQEKVDKGDIESDNVHLD